MEGHQSAVYTQGQKNLKPLTWMFWGGGPCPVCLDLTMCILEFAAVTNLELSPRKSRDGSMRLTVTVLKGQRKLQQILLSEGNAFPYLLKNS